jgi:hypothetical protein
MITQSKLDSFLDKYFSGDNVAANMLRKLIQKPSRHLLPPKPTADNEYTDDRMLRIAGQLIGYSYLRTYITDTNLYILRVVVINDKVVYLSVGAKNGTEWVDKDTEYFFLSDPYANGVQLQFLTDDTEQCNVSFVAGKKQLVQAGNEFIERKEQEAYATYRDLKNYMQAELREAANSILYK